MPAPIPAPPPFATASVSGTVSTAAQVFGGIKSLNSILGLAQYATGALPAAASYEGHVAYDSTLNKFVYSDGSAWVSSSSSVAVGDSIGSATAGSVLFAGVAGVLAQDNANLFWDNTNNFLGIGTATPLYKFQVDHAATSRAQIAGSTFMSNITAMSRHASLAYGGAVGLSTNLDTGAIIFAGDPDTGALGLAFVAQTFANIRDNTPIGANTGINGGSQVSYLYSGGRWEHTPSNAGAIETLTEGIAYGAKYAMTVARNATDARSNSILKLLPTFNQGGSNSSHTVNVFEIDTVNTAVTGTTINLAKMSYGATERFRFGSAGDLLVGGSAGTNGHFLKSNGAGAAVTWEAATGSVDVGSSIASGTVGSVLFVGTGPVLAQDNAKLFWDNTNDRLGIGTATPDKALDITTSVNASVLLRVQNTSASGFSAATFHNSLTTKTLSIGYGNASASSPYTDVNYIDWDSSNLHFIGRVTATPTVVGSISLAGLLTTRLGFNISETTGEFQLGGSAGNAGQVLTSAGAGARPTWSAASTTTAIGGTITSGTAGSIIFVGTGPVLAQDNAKLFWDDSNDRLGVGNASPAESVDITGAVKVSTYVKIGSNTIGYAAAAPVAGTWAQGDIIYNTGATAGSSVGWVCTVAGTPGTWKEFGPISL